MALSTLTIFAVVGSVLGWGSILYSLRAAHSSLEGKIEEFIEKIGEIQISPQMEVGVEAMELQMEAAKQAQVFDFLRSIVGGGGSGSDVAEMARDAAGKFS